MTNPTTPPGWYPDPSGSGGQRYWDGTQWTQQVAPGPQPAPPGPQYGYGPGFQVGYPPGAFDNAPGLAPAPVMVKPAPALWWLVPIGYALLAIGSVGPWIDTSLPIDKSGLHFDGPALLGFDAVALVLLVLWRFLGHRWLAIVSVPFTLFIAVAAIIDVSDVNGLESGLLDVKAAWGLYVAAAGAVVFAIPSVVLSFWPSRRGREVTY
jgi:hypothetical protein